MPSHRIDRLNSDMQKELSVLIRELKDPRITELLSVMRVEVSSDLSYAKVYIGSLTGGDDARSSCDLLNKHVAGHLRSEISKRLRIRKSPQLTFIPDSSAEYYEKISTLLEKAADEK